MRFTNYILKLGIILLLLSPSHKSVLAQQKEFSGKSHLDSIFLLMNTNPDRAIELSSDLYQKYKGKNPNMEISILTILGSSYSIKKDYEKAIEYALKARDLSKKTNDHATQIQVAGFIGEKYHNLNINSKAKYYCDEAFSLIEKINPLPDSLRVYKGNLLFLKGLIYRDELGCEFAIDYYNRAINEYKPLLNKRDMIRFSLGDIYNVKGFCFLEINQLDSAKIAFSKTLAYSENEDFPLLTSESWAGLARVDYLKKNYEEAKKNFDKALQIINSNSLEGFTPDIYKYMSDNYYALNDIENYTRFLNLYKQSTNTEVNAKKKSVNEIIDKSSGKESGNEKKEKNKYRIIIGALVAALLTLTSIVIYQILITKKKIKEFKNQISKHPEKKLKADDQ